MISPQRGEVWLVDLGLAAKVRPALVLSVPFEDADRALVTLVPLEEGLKARARAEALTVDPRETVNPLLEKLTKSGTLSAFEADRLRGMAKMRNEAAHGGEFNYGAKDVAAALDDVRSVLGRTLGRGH